MHISRIQIEKFLGLKKVDFEIDSKFQIIAGPNNSGKTTLTKAIHLFFSKLKQNIDQEKFLPKNRYYVQGNITKIKITFKGLSSDEINRFRNCYSNRTKSFWIEIKIKKDGRFSYKSSSNDSDGDKVHEKLINNYHVTYVPVLRVDDKGIAKNEIRRLNYTIRDTLIKNRPGPKTKTQKSFIRSIIPLSKIILKVLDNSKEYAKKMLPKESEIKFSFPRYEDLLFSILHNISIFSRDELSIKSHDEGTGFQSLLSLGLLKHLAKDISKHTNQNILFLIEEPEAFLHPQAQRHVAKFLKDLSGDSQIISTTHSTVLVDSVNIEQIARLKKEPKGLEWVVKIPKKLPNEERGRLSRYLDIKNSEIVFARKVIFCEGIGDANIIKTLMNIFYEDEFYESNISIINMDSKDKAPYFVDLAKRFNIPFLLIFDNDVYMGDTSTIKKILKKEENKVLVYRAEKRIRDYKDNPVENLGQAKTRRNLINRAFRKIGIFFLSGDIEFGVATSFTKDKLIKKLSTLGVFSSHDIEKLNTGNYYENLRLLFGSKGWNSEKANKKEKIKQHIMPLLIRELCNNISKDSDLDRLKTRLGFFILSKLIIRRYKNLKKIIPID